MINRSLIELHADGYVRVYGHPATRPFIFNRPVARTAEAGNLVDQLVEECLPGPFKEIYNPGWVRATNNLRRVTVDDLVRALERMAVVNKVSDPPKNMYIGDVVRGLW